MKAAATEAEENKTGELLHYEVWGKNKINIYIYM